jgi:hypothetical protein
MKPRALRSASRTALLGVLAACGGGSFTASSKIQSVRILATVADQPYAKPGSTVKLTTLAADGRTDRSTAMKLYWLPISCSNPPGDVYYACFASLAGRPTAGGSGGTGGPMLQPGVDLTPFLPQGPDFTVKVPGDVITTHRPQPGSVAPFGTVFAFNIACAGHIEIIPFDPNNINPQAPPIGCFDASHNQLGPDDYVIGFTEIFSFDAITNENPTIDHATLQSMPVDPALGLTFDHCGGNSGTSCLENDIDVVVPDSSWEVNPGDVDPQTNTQHHEVLWVDYYATDGDFGSDAKLLYDAIAGKLPDPHVTYTPPDHPAELTMWIVVHDNRGGTAWLVLPVHVR